MKFAAQAYPALHLPHRPVLIPPQPNFVHHVATQSGWHGLATGRRGRVGWTVLHCDVPKTREDQHLRMGGKRVTVTRLWCTFGMASARHQRIWRSYRRRCLFLVVVDTGHSPICQKLRQSYREMLSFLVFLVFKDPRFGGSEEEVATLVTSIVSPLVISYPLV
jgi:hypothetical protein